MNTADITADDLIALVRAYNPKTNENQIRLAYEYGQQMHEGQFRHSGEPYFTHPVSVAAILTEQQLDDATIITALLHDTIEDTKASYSSVDEKFGHDVAELVDGVTKLTNLQLNSNETKQAENFRKLFMAMSKDLRVILVKLADRLHNMRTIKSMRPDKQIQKARETMDIYAPLAGRMGMQWMREELEDLAFRVLNPEGRQRIQSNTICCTLTPQMEKAFLLEFKKIETQKGTRSRDPLKKDTPGNFRASCDQNTENTSISLLRARVGGRKAKKGTGQKKGGPAKQGERKHTSFSQTCDTINTP